MSDSEDDFMSDKFLVEASAPKQQTYTQRREAERLKSLRKGQAKNMPSMAQLEKERRAEGLNRSLFDDAGPSRPTDTSASGGASTSGSSSRTAGGNKAMEMMMKMGWKVGEGLGKRSPSPPAGSSKRARLDDGNEDEEEGAARGGIGSKSLGTRGRAEPIRVSLWAGRKGLTARSPSPPPLRTSSNRNPDALDPAKLAMLGDRANDFRAVQRLQFALKETEKKEWQARDMLVQLDDEQGIRYHPLHAMRSNPLKTLPKPLKRLIYPVEVVSESPDSEPTELPDAQPIIGPIMPDMPTAQPTGTETKHERYISEAEKTRERMRRDMLSAIPTEEEQTIQARKRALGLDGEGEGEKAEEDKKRYQKTVWAEMVSGTKKVLAMGAETHLRFLLSQLRNEHMYCLWCSTKYSSFEEMDGPGGCPGEDEDDH